MLEVKNPTAETTLLLQGPAGDLEVLLSPPPSEDPPKAIAIICHPHPLYGGTMTNKVVTTLSKAFNQLEMQTIRFNFRGIGKSAGTYADGIGEQEDLLAVIEWITEISPKTPIWLAGFSFGAYISICIAAQQTFAGLVSVAPPVNRFPFEVIPVITCPWIVVQGEKDEVVPVDDVKAWTEKLNPRPELILFPDATHFFHGQLTELRDVVVQKLKAVG